MKQIVTPKPKPPAASPRSPKGKMGKKSSMQSRINWQYISNPPEESGDVLLAMTHNNIPMVIMGFCKVRKEGLPVFSEPYYSGVNVQMNYWAKMPEYPTRGDK